MLHAILENINRTYSDSEKFQLVLLKNDWKQHKKQIFFDIFNEFVNHPNKDIDTIKYDDIEFTNEEISIFQYLKDLYLKICQYKIEISCNFKEELCKSETINYLSSLDNLKSFFGIFDYINKNISENPDEKCKRCVLSSVKVFQKIKREITNSDLHQYFSNKYSSFNLNRNFIVNQLISIEEIKSRLSQDKLLNTQNNIVQTYTTFDNIYQVEIYRNVEKMRYFYQFNINLSEKLLEIYHNMEHFFKEKLKTIKLEFYTQLGKKITHLHFQLVKLIKNYLPEIDEQDYNKLGYIVTLKILKLHNIFPLLIDPQIEEIFLDQVNQPLYLIHQDYGKCDTSIVLHDSEIEAVKTFIKLECGKKLDQAHPNLLYVMQNTFFNCRFSIDLFPNHWKNLSFDIRKMNKTIYNIFNLIEFGTLNNEILAFILFIILVRGNITISGEINAGKTTLLNALDLLTPSNYRKIYVEDTIETLEIPFSENYQLKYISKGNELKDLPSKERDIYQLLHRSGDYIFLGEILTKEETKALFHSLSVGLRGIQTTHSSNITSLINRWIVHYSIEKSCLNDLGIIIFLKKIANKRIISSILELEYIDDEIIIHPFFLYNPLNSNWSRNEDLENSKIVKNLKDFVMVRQKDLEFIMRKINVEIEKNKLKEKHNISNPFLNLYRELQIEYNFIGGV